MPNRVMPHPASAWVPDASPPLPARCGAEDRVAPLCACSGKGSPQSRPSCPLKLQIRSVRSKRGFIPSDMPTGAWLSHVRSRCSLGQLAWAEGLRHEIGALPFGKILGKPPLGCRERRSSAGLGRATKLCCTYRTRPERYFIRFCPQLYLICNVGYLQTEFAIKRTM